MASRLRIVVAALAVGLSAGLATTLSAAAQKPSKQPVNPPEHPAKPVVVELFSSQGCGNCPQANANLVTMAKRSDVIALTYPVGYWDYLGWNDTFAKPEFTERQKRYNRVLGHRGPYTPQVIYSGRLHGSGTNLAGIMSKFGERDVVTPYPAKVVFSGEDVTVSGTTDKKAGVILVRFKPGAAKITPGAGANKGKEMTYLNVVTGVEQIGEWSGGEKTYKTKCVTGCVVLIQQGGMEGTVVGVAQKK